MSPAHLWEPDHCCWPQVRGRNLTTLLCFCWGCQACSVRWQSSNPVACLPQSRAQSSSCSKWRPDPPSPCTSCPHSHCRWRYPCRSYLHHWIPKLHVWRRRRSVHYMSSSKLVLAPYHHRPYEIFTPPSHYHSHHKSSQTWPRGNLQWPI
jgi:hypothetical protein